MYAYRISNKMSFLPNKSRLLLVQNPPGATSSLTAFNLIMRSPQQGGTVRREQVNNDPLLDSGMANMSGRTTPLSNIPTSEQHSFEPPNYPRLVSAMDQIELQTEVFLKNCRRKPVNSKDVSQDISGLQELAEAHAWQHVVALSSKMLFENENSVLNNKVWQLRFEGLFRMKMYDELATEANNLLAIEEGKQIEVNPNILVSMKLLISEVKVMTGRNQEALDQLYVTRSSLQAEVTGTHSSAYSTRFWLLQVGSHIVNAAVRLRNWKTAVNELRRLLCDVKAEIVSGNEAFSVTDVLSLKRSQVIIMLRLSRVLLQIGAVKDSSSYYERASQLCTADASIAQNCNIDSHLLLNQGLILMCSGQAQQYSQALDIFTTIMDSERGRAANKGVEAVELSGISLHPSSAPSPTSPVFCLFTDNEESVLASAVNNAAICALYIKRIAQAIGALETLIVDDPGRNMTDPVIFNLCTLYDLSFAPDTSTIKKKVLQKVAARFGVDDPVLHWRSFRLT